MMWCVPSLTSPVISGGRVAGSAQPVLPAGGGLVLRPWRPEDARAVAAAYADPAIQRWHARRIDSEDEARDLILRWQRSWPSETGAHWAVTRGEGGEVAGRVALRSMIFGSPTGSHSADSYVANGGPPRSSPGLAPCHTRPSGAASGPWSLVRIGA
jgi:hypothetical protein